MLLFVFSFLSDLFLLKLSFVTALSAYPSSSQLLIYFVLRNLILCFVLDIELVVIMPECFVEALFNPLGLSQTYKMNQIKLKKITDTGNKVHRNFHHKIFLKDFLSLTELQLLKP